MLTAQRVEELAHSVGLPVVGCAAAGALPELLPVLMRFYTEGRASGFEHPVANERIDPQMIMPGARTVIAVALPYRTHDTMQARRPKGQRGLTSIYMWGEDYHIVLRDKLRSLALLLELELGHPLNSEVCVDTSPLLDRAIAVRAGIGWIGKNTCLITERYGSWVFLGALLIDAEVVDDADVSASSADEVHYHVRDDWKHAALAPLALDECGACTLCLTACPTGALRDPYVLDSSSCLSYLTQEKGIMPEPYRALLGKRLWGCDTCQTVCPKNHTSLLGTEPRMAPDVELSFPDLCAVLMMSGREFKRRYGRTAGAWRGATVWKRNALIALGNMRDRSALPVILPYLQASRKELRACAAWALLQIDPAGSREAVGIALAQEEDVDVRAEMAWAR